MQWSLNITVGLTGLISMAYAQPPVIAQGAYAKAIDPYLMMSSPQIPVIDATQWQQPPADTLTLDAFPVRTPDSSTYTGICT